MRKLFLLPFVALLLCCSNDDGEKVSNELSIVGRWYLESTSVNGEIIPEDGDIFDCSEEKKNYIEFKSNGEIVVFNYYECQDEFYKGTYEVSNNKLLTIMEGETSILDIVIITKTRMAVQYLEDDNEDGVAEVIVQTLYR